MTQSRNIIQIVPSFFFILLLISSTLLFTPCPNPTSRKPPYFPKWNKSKRFHHIPPLLERSTRFMECSPINALPSLLLPPPVSILCLPPYPHPYPPRIVYNKRKKKEKPKEQENNLVDR
ncbi:hypothetical protein QBC36DRAFT_108956 [Triangularia setosa]|uniref:Transmembrane protein n=1 Tax=Triangularia setosa TaxID=2587417 RepID=A0AAN6WB26_9PEZI|nr:hypothetical protein QBC36DRAFT_108956 [Podospora setosa]